jgi:hypothetical protein
MTDDSYERRRELSFAQAEGIDPLPSQLKRTEVSPQMSSIVWAFLHRDISSIALEEMIGRWRFIWEDILKDYTCILSVDL